MILIGHHVRRQYSRSSEEHETDERSTDRRSSVRASKLLHAQSSKFRHLTGLQRVLLRTEGTAERGRCRVTQDSSRRQVSHHSLAVLHSHCSCFFCTFSSFKQTFNYSTVNRVNLQRKQLISVFSFSDSKICCFFCFTWFWIEFLWVLNCCSDVQRRLKASPPALRAWKWVTD